MDTRRKPTDTDISLINPMVIQVMADITRILTEDTVEGIQKILTEDMVEVYQKILMEDMADIKRIRTGDMAEIKWIRTEDMEAVIKNNLTEDMVADIRLVHMVTAIPTDTKNITEPSTIPTTLKLP